MKSFARVSMRFAAVFGGLLALAPSIRAEVITKGVDTPTVEVWTIREPNISQPVSVYPFIRFRPGDDVTIIAGGCDQTGGHGKTWKRYVDPQGPNSDRLYHGLIGIPGVTAPTNSDQLTRIAYIATEPLSPGVWRGSFTIPRSANPYYLYLQLGFEDDGYGDNGYWGREGDDGTGDQCKGLPNAMVQVSITHH